MDLFNKASSGENLKLAFQYIEGEIDESTLSLDPIWKPAISAIRLLGDNIFDSLSTFVRSEKYKPESADHVYAQKDSLSARPICVFSVIDRIFFQAILNPGILGNIIDKKLFNFCYGNRISGKYSYLNAYKQQWIKFCDNQKQLFQDGYVWRAEFDIQSFFEEISIDILISILKDDFNVKDNKLLSLLHDQLTTWAEVPPTKLGIPQGPNASQVLANAYLYPLDNFIDDLDPIDFKYIRYADDLIIMSKSSGVLNEIIEKIVIFLRKYNLKLNEKTKLEKLINVSLIEESRFYNHYGFINKTSKQKIKKIEKKLPAILSKIKNGKGLNKIEKGSLNYYLKAGPDSSELIDSKLINKFIDIIPYKPSHALPISKYLAHYISEFYVDFFVQTKDITHIRYKKIWTIYQNKTLTWWTKFCLLKLLSSPSYAQKYKLFQNELLRITNDNHAGLLHSIALTFDAYTKEQMGKIEECIFSSDTIKRCIKYSKSNAERASYYYFLIYIKNNENVGVIKGLMSDALQSGSPEVQLIGLFLFAKLAINFEQEGMGDLAKIYLKLPISRKVALKETKQLINEDYITFEGRIAKNQLTRFIGISDSNDKKINLTSNTTTDIHERERRKDKDSSCDQDKVKIKEKVKEVYPIFLVLKGDAFCISGKELDGINYKMQSITEAGSGAYIDPLLKVCKICPSKFKTITADDLKTKSVMKDSVLDDALKKVPLFKRYLSNLGLKGKLRNLFYANSPSGLFKFRIAIPTEEWDKFPKVKKKNLVNSICKFPVLET